MNLRSQMQRIALRWPAYGYRRVHAELLRQGWTINHKRVLRLLRADNLLCVRRRKFMLGTTDSRHGWRVYPNLAAGMMLTSIDQLWVADITYIRLQWEFVYLAVVLDAFSRRCLGWALQRSLESALALEALRMALTRRRPPPGLVHHSDRGVQYASRDYTTQLEQHGIRISMSRLAMPYDNAQAESFMKTLKYEEVYRTEYRDLEEARGLIKQFLEEGLQPAALAFGSGISAATGVRTQPTTIASGGEKKSMSFLRHGEIYRSDVIPGYSWERQLVSPPPVLIGCDEFPVGYSLAGCPPAEPASASSTGADSQQPTLPYNDFSANGNYPLNFVSHSKGALHSSPFAPAPPYRR